MTVRTRIVASVLCLLVTSLCAVAHADSGAELLKKGIAQYREASYASSVSALESARASKQLSALEVAECDFYLGASYMALNSLPAARREFAAVLAIQPEYDLPQYTSPKVRALFAEVKQEVEHAPKLRALAPVEKAGALEIAFDAPSGSYGSLYYRCSGETKFVEAPLAHEGKRLAAQIAARCPLTQYFAEARFADGLLRAGSEAEPLEVTANGEAKPGVAAAVLAPLPNVKPAGESWAKRHTWLWVTLGVAAGAGAGILATYYIVRSTDPPKASAVFTFGAAP